MYRFSIIVHKRKRNRNSMNSSFCSRSSTLSTTSLIVTLFIQQINSFTCFKDIVMPTWHTYSAHNKRAEKENLNPLIRHKYSTFTIWVARREMYKLKLLNKYATTFTISIILPLCRLILRANNSISLSKI